MCTQKVYRGFESLSLRHEPIGAKPKLGEKGELEGEDEGHGMGMGG